MTRAEAIMLLKKHLPSIFNGEKVVDFYIEAGMLKVEEEKTIRERAKTALHTGHIDMVFNQLDEAGLKIVEK